MTLIIISLNFPNGDIVVFKILIDMLTLYENKYKQESVNNYYLIIFISVLNKSLWLY